MLQKQFNFITMFLSGAFFCTLGCMLILNRMGPWDWVYITFVIGMYAIAGLHFINLIINFKKLTKRIFLVLDILMWLTLGILSSYNPGIFNAVLPRLVGVWLLLHAVVKGIVIYIKKKNKLHGEMRYMIVFLFDLIMSFYLLFRPYEQRTLVCYGVGIYFLIYGGNVLLNLIRELVPRNSGEVLDRKIRLAVPPFIAAIIPPSLMRTILDKDEDELLKVEFDAYKSNIETNLEVMIHLAPSGPAMLGHTDIIYRDFVISYGCYDPHNRHLVGTLGDGVVLMAPRDAYLKNCLMNENKVLVGFGISINEEQKTHLDQRLLEVFGTFKDFQSDEELKEQGLPFKGECDDYISRVARRVPAAKFYKLNDKKFKTFFVCYSNCVYFVSHILSVIGLNLIDLSGIISPGSYFDFLNKQFKSDKSFVVSRKVYRRKDAAAL